MENHIYFACLRCSLTHTWKLASTQPQKWEAQRKLGSLSRHAASVSRAIWLDVKADLQQTSRQVEGENTALLSSLSCLHDRVGQVSRRVESDAEALSRLAFKGALLANLF